jgi:hypothetical protein
VGCGASDFVRAPWRLRTEDSSRGPLLPQRILPPIPAGTARKYSKRSPLTVLSRQQVQIISPLRRQRRATVLEFGTWAFVFGITLTVLLLILTVLVLWSVLR